MKSKDLIYKFGRLAALVFFLVQIIRASKPPILHEYSFIIGIAPNILGVIFLMAYLSENVNKWIKYTFTTPVFYVLIYLLSVLILVGWEYFRLVTAGLRFDMDDILASVVTGLIFLFFMLFYKKSITHKMS